MTENLHLEWLLPLLGVLAAAVWLGFDNRRQRRRVRRLVAEAREHETGRRQLETQLKQAHRMEAVGILAGSIVNNLNNLLAVILGHTRMASHELPAATPVQDELERVMKAGHVATELVRELSDFYRQADQARKPTALLPVVRDTVKLLRDILPASVTVQDDLKNCGPVLVTTTAVQQILMNLASNAMNAMLRGRGTLEVTLSEEVVTGWHKAVPQELGPGSYVRLSVRDDGRGMDQATLEHIFESYFTGAEGEGKGMGIGLSTVYRILESHDGAAIVRSQVGRGSTFDLFFPLIAWSVPQPETELISVAPARSPVLAAITPATAVVADADTPVVSGPTLVPSRVTATKATVLLVDDEEMVSKVLSRGLRRLGYRVVTHNDSRNALNDFVATPEIFDVLVTDQIMPHMSGVRLTRRIHDVRPDLPVILLTGFRDSFNEQQAREAGIGEFLLKPSSHRDLAELIDRVVLRQGESRA
ncbi:response regulator [bacterium]|nr:response regulator [bacterium]